MRHKNIVVKALVAVSIVLLSAPGSFALNSCDLSGDGNITPGDALCVLQEYVGMGCDDCTEVYIEELEARIAQLEALLTGITRDKHNLVLDGMNLHIRNGANFSRVFPSNIFSWMRSSTGSISLKNGWLPYFDFFLFWLCSLPVWDC